MNIFIQLWHCCHDCNWSLHDCRIRFGLRHQRQERELLRCRTFFASMGEFKYTTCIHQPYYDDVFILMTLTHTHAPYHIFRLWQQRWPLNRSIPMPSSDVPPFPTSTTSGMALFCQLVLVYHLFLTLSSSLAKSTKIRLLLFPTYLESVMESSSRS